MKMTKIKVALFASLLLSILLAGVVYAGSTSKNGGVGDAWCTATKRIVQGSSQWDAYMTSSCV